MKAGEYRADRLLPGDRRDDDGRVVKDCIGQGDMVVVDYDDGSQDIVDRTELVAINAPK